MSSPCIILAARWMFRLAVERVVSFVSCISSAYPMTAASGERSSWLNAIIMRSFCSIRLFFSLFSAMSFSLSLYLRLMSLRMKTKKVMLVAKATNAIRIMNSMDCLRMSANSVSRSSLCWDAVCWKSCISLINSRFNRSFLICKLSACSSIC